MKKLKKVKKFLKNHKKLIIGTSIFVVLGLVGLLIGFEMTNDWHAIRNWLSSPYATTFFICVVLGVIALIVLIFTFMNFRKED